VTPSYSSALPRAVDIANLTLASSKSGMVFGLLIAQTGVTTACASNPTLRAWARGTTACGGHLHHHGDFVDAPFAIVFKEISI
jgi:hypothetical protein